MVLVPYMSLDSDLTVWNMTLQLFQFCLSIPVGILLSNCLINEYYTRVLVRISKLRVLASRVSGCLFGTLVHEKYLFMGEKTPYLLVNFF